MSVKHPIIAITGSSGAGTTSVMLTFEQIFRREGVNAAFLEGDSFHRYNRAEMKEKISKALAHGEPHFSHFGDEANLFEELAEVFRGYGASGRGRRRKYLHDEEEAKPYGQKPGTFTPWEEIPANTDLLFYEGLHGAVVTERVDIAQHPVLVLRNHGLLATGRNVAEAFSLTYHFERSAESQLKIQAAVAGGAKMVIPAPDTCERQAAQFQGNMPRLQGQREWPALLRLCDRLDPNYRT